jgi:hypothetical protein
MLLDSHRLPRVGISFTSWFTLWPECLLVAWERHNVSVASQNPAKIGNHVLNRSGDGSTDSPTEKREAEYTHETTVSSCPHKSEKSVLRLVVARL